MNGKQSIGSAFGRAAQTYDLAAHPQREACERLAQLATQWMPVSTPTYALDAGCGTGQGLSVLNGLCPDATCLSLDLAPAMLKQLQRNVRDNGMSPALVAGDIERLPLKDESCGVIWSSLALQWCHPVAALAEFGRVSKGDATVWLSTLGPDTLQELRAAFADVDAAEHTIAFHAPDVWTDSARTAGFKVLACEQAHIHARADTLRGLLRDIKSIGAHTVAARRQGLMGRQTWRRLTAYYERYRQTDGKLPATYDVILLALRKRF